jgi:cardiolipin synthase
LAREANVVVDDASFAQDLRQRLDQAMQTEGRVIDPLAYAHRPLSQRLLDGVAYWLMRGMLFLNGSRY